jgi:hypothetical protein
MGTLEVLDKAIREVGVLRVQFRDLRAERDRLAEENARLSERNCHLEGFLNGVMQLGSGNPQTVDLLIGLTRLCEEARLLMTKQARTSLKASQP